MSQKLPVLLVENRFQNYFLGLKAFLNFEKQTPE